MSMSDIILAHNLLKSNDDIQMAVKALVEYQAANQFSLKEMNEICRDGREFAIGLIYGY